MARLLSSGKLHPSWHGKAAWLEHQLPLLVVGKGLDGGELWLPWSLAIGLLDDLVGHLLSLLTHGGHHAGLTGLGLLAWLGHHLRLALVLLVLLVLLLGPALLWGRCNVGQVGGGLLLLAAPRCTVGSPWLWWC